MTTHMSESKVKKRLVGIDLFRGISAYAVALIHAGSLMLYSGIPTNNVTAALVEMSRFAVPFFLALSFYFMTKKLYTSNQQHSLISIFQSRSERLLVPYFYWSLIYLSIRLVKSLSASENLSKLFQDPVLLIFLGGASIHLYFLPLLFTGSFLIVFAEFLVKKRISLTMLFVLFIASIVIYELQIVSGNNFEFFAKFGVNCLEVTNSCSVAFQQFTKLIFPSGNNNQILRIGLVVIAWLLKCLPYILLAMIINHPYMRKKVEKLDINQAVIFLIFMAGISALNLMNIEKIIYFPQSIYEIGTAFCLLLSGIALSTRFSNNRYIENLGICSFGIYLIHYIVLMIYVSLMGKIPDELLRISPITIMLTLTSITFVTSWLITSMSMRVKPISKLLFRV
ncbi:MAG: acyltransferase [Tolypothrix carrinoi HA7290-LM1]|jgi:peptidoglycan/LPS O-acetylase OafA/YrhL|nr:acyltransferase [Tolypothrix carrinoi HA7290-LM1]